MKALHSIAFILVIVGGLNWLLAVFAWDIGNFLPDVVSKIVYVLVGLSALYLIATHKKDCKNCNSGASTPTATM
jgi:uncharacterized membrane protein YuzA (DUF378 family)